MICRDVPSLMDRAILELSWCNFVNSSFAGIPMYRANSHILHLHLLVFSYGIKIMTVELLALRPGASNY